MLQDLETRVKGQVQATFDRRQVALPQFPALLGRSNTTGSATLDGTTRYVYARIGSDEDLVIIYNNRTPHTNGLAVVVGKEPSEPDLFQVLSERAAYPMGTNLPTLTPGHWMQHAWGHGQGFDILWVQPRQIDGCRVFPTDPASLEVQISQGIYEIGTTLYEWDGLTTLDLTTYVPGTNSRWVLITMTDAGPVATAGTIKAALTIADIPDSPNAADWRLAAVLMKVGDTAVTDFPDPDWRIVDLRLAGSRSASGSGFVDFANCIVVAVTGGNYDNVQDGVDAATSETFVLLLNGTWAENIAFTGTQITAGGLLDAHVSGAFGVFITGADDVGPILSLDGTGIWGNCVIARGMSGGAGAFLGIDATNVLYSAILTDMRVDIRGLASGRDVYALKLGGPVSSVSSLSRSRFVTGTTNPTAATVEVTSGNADLEFCEFENLDGDAGLRIATTGTVELYQCRISGDLEITAAATVYLRDCNISGDLVATAGATVSVKDSTITGNITGTAGAVLVVGNCDTQGTISGWDRVGGSIVYNAGTYCDWNFQGKANNSASYMRVAPTGSPSGYNRASTMVFLTDWMADQTNIEGCEFVAFDDGVDLFFALRSVAGGTGTLRELRLGVGPTKTDYLRITTTGNLDMSGKTLTNATLLGITGYNSTATFVDVDGTSSNVRPIKIAATYDGTTNGGAGIAFLPTVSPTAAVSTQYGLYSVATLGAALINVSAFWGNFFRADVGASYTGVLSAMAVARFSNPVVSGNAPVTFYGIYIDPMTAGTSWNFSIYAPGGTAFFKTGATNRVGVQVRGETGQTFNLQEWQDGSGTILCEVQADGDLNMRTSGILFVDSNARIQTLSTIRIFHTGNTTATIPVGHRFSSTTSATGATQYTMQVYGTKSVADANSYYGMDFYARCSAATGTQNIMYGINARTRLTGAATVTTAYGIFCRIDIDTTGTIGTATALRIDSPYVPGAGVITNLYGIYVAGQTIGGTFNYAIFTAGGTVYHQTGLTTLVGHVVQGENGQTANLTEWRDYTGATLTQVENDGSVLIKSYLAVGNNAATTAQNIVTVDAFRSTTTGTERVIYVQGFFQPATAATGTKIGAEYQVNWNNTSSLAADQLIGQRSTTLIVGAATIGTALGLSAFVRVNNTVAATLTNMWGISSTIDAEDATVTETTNYLVPLANVDTGSINRSHGLKITSSVIGAGSIVNQYGIYIETVSGASSGNYAIYTNTGTVRFGDVVQVTGTMTTANIEPDGNKTRDLGASGTRWNTLYQGTSTAAGTSRTFASKRDCPGCGTPMIRGTGSLCILGVDQDWEVAHCPACGILATEDVCHLTDARRMGRRPAPRIDFRGFKVFEMSGNSRKVRVDFSYGKNGGDLITNSTYLGEIELEDFFRMTNAGRRAFLRELGQREWDAMEEVRLMQGHVERLQGKLDGLGASLVGQL